MQLVQAVRDASIIQGEFKRMLLSIGIVMLILVVIWGLQEFGARNSQIALGWFGLICMMLVFMGGAILTTVGLL
jgi:hypothetical protein